MRSLQISCLHPSTPTAGIEACLSCGMLLPPELKTLFLAQGMQMSHPDLRSNRWRNLGEVNCGQSEGDCCTDGVDNDDNGFVDDCYGYNFADDVGCLSEECNSLEVRARVSAEYDSPGSCCLMSCLIRLRKRFHRAAESPSCVLFKRGRIEAFPLSSLMAKKNSLGWKGFGGV